MKNHSPAVSFDPHALMARRVLPVVMTVMLWSVLIESARLLVLAL